MNIDVYEGYLRNQKQLCEQLGILPGSSRNETERRILIEGYRHWGYDLVYHLNGAFAFALWDEKKQEMFCARDPFGIKCLFYHITKNKDFLCACDIDLITESEGFQKEINRQSLQYYMMFGYPVGEQTLYQGLTKLMPGRRLIYRRGECRIERYFTPNFESDEGVSEEVWIARIDDTLQTILEEDKKNFDFSKARCFLSGGVDSSYLLAASGVPNACNIGFDEGGVGEQQYASDTAALFGVALQKINLSADDFFEAIPAFLRNTQLPLSDPSAVAFSIGCRHAAESTSLCLSGEGADEFFAGYHIYRRAEELAAQRYCGCFGVMEEVTARRLLGFANSVSPETLVQDIYEKENITDNLNRMLAVDIALWLEGDILFNVNSNTRAYGIDLLLPFADRRMFELSAKIPSSLKLKDGCGKYIFRKAARKRLPNETAFRAKAGFPVPVKKWFAEEKYRAGIESVLFGENASLFFDTVLLREYWEQFCNGKGILFQTVYTIYIFLRWYEEIFNAEMERR